MKIRLTQNLHGLFLGALFSGVCIPAFCTEINVTGAATRESSKVDFNRDVRPILSANCYACHGPDKNKRKSGLRLDEKEGAFKKLKSDGFAIVSGKPNESVLLQRLITQDDEEHMPPKKSGKELSVAQIKTLRTWIEQGAEWKPHWSYIPPERAALPQPNKAQWCRNAVDNFILSRLEKEGLAPSAEAEKTTLIRRLSFDLRGLPPSVDEVREFLADTGANAYEKAVDRMLSSPHYGERMAMYWLDLVRFADTIGYHSDNPKNISPYRDYVIDAFNQNKPFDRFTIEQLAGDLIPDATLTQKIASGYNRLNMTTEEGGAQAKEYEAKYAADRVRNASSVWMAATMGCCECHDHKFDPYSSKDFYSFAAFFADVKENIVGAREAGLPVPNSEQAAELKRLDDKIDALKKKLDAPTPELAAAQTEWEQLFKGFKFAEWSVLTPHSANSEKGATLKIDKDHTILASGKNLESDTYTIKVTTALKGITAVRLDVLPDKSLPHNGPGRAEDGNFALTEFILQADAAGSDKPRPFALQNASASFEQKDSPAGQAIAKNKDAQDKHGWAVLQQTGQENHAVFELGEPAGTGSETALMFVLKQNFGTSHTLGHFKLSASTAPHPVRAAPGKDVTKEIAAILELESGKRTDAQKQALAAQYRSFAPLLQPVRADLAATENAKAEMLKKIPTTLVSDSGTPRMVRVKARGNWMDESGDIVSPSVPHFLPQVPLEKKDARATRLDLAKWMVARDNPMTARVFVNRLWKLFFGQGISKSLDDLGAQGEWPTHPELLDWLAVEFEESHWDIKHVVKLLVMSNTYRQSSTGSKELKERDPYNRLMARQSQFRLDAEMVRDNALAISGLLTEKIGGLSVKPYQPKDYWSFLNFPTRTWQPDKGENEYRRGLYTFWQRTFLHPSLLAFDAPSREECTAERSRSNTPQQALVLLNDPTYVEAARVFAEEIIKDHTVSVAHPVDKLDWAYLRALARPPTENERQVLTALYAKHLDEYTKDKSAASQLLAAGDAPLPKETDVPQLAAWTSVARVILNLHETITRY